MNKEELINVLRKTLKGALIAATGTAALYILNALQALQINNIMVAGFIAWIIPVATNFIKEWMNGNKLAAARKLAAQNPNSNIDS